MSLLKTGGFLGKPSEFEIRLAESSLLVLGSFFFRISFRRLASRVGFSGRSELFTKSPVQKLRFDVIHWPLAATPQSSAVGCSGFVTTNGRVTPLLPSLSFKNPPYKFLNLIRTLRGTL